MAQPAPRRTQSSTSLSRFYNSGANGGPIQDEEMADPKMDFCNAFWGQGDRGYEVVMARLRGAGRTLDELKAFWKERAAIEEDYSRRLQKLSKTTLGKDEIGDLAAALQNCLTETAQQAQYHQSLASEIKTNVEQPTAELAARLVGFKKGQQAGIEKAWRNKGLQEGHVSKARERYESDCLKLNSYTANQALSQGREADKLQQKLEKARQSIGQSEQDFRQFVRVLEGTQGKWEHEWKGFCDDLEEDRLAMTKDIVWAYANAVSQVCVEDDSSCERVREKLEQFEPQSDMVAFVRGWGTGDQIPDAPRFINYSAGEYPAHPSSHIANFNRSPNKEPLAALSRYTPDPTSAIESSQARASKPEGESNGYTGGIGDLNLQDRSSTPPPPAVPAETEKPRQPFGGVAMPGMAPTSASTAPTAIARAASPAPVPANAEALPKRYSSMGPPAPATSMTMPEPRVPSRQGQNPPTPTQPSYPTQSQPTTAQIDDEDPMAKALADLRRDPPPPDSIRRNASHRRPESMYSNAGATAGSRAGIPQSSSPAPGAAGGAGNRASYQAPGSASGALSPPPAGHTAAALAKSMDEFHRQSNSKRGSTSYGASGQEIANTHSSRPTSRSTSPAPGPGSRGPSSAMMQPPSQPITHIADEVLSQYHQAFPGEREKQSRSRAGSVISNISQGGGRVSPHPGQPGSPAPREGFTGIGAGGRSPSPAPPANFASPVPSPNMGHGQINGNGLNGNLGPQNMGIKLDAAGGVAQDSMAEAYRRQYQQSQSQQQPQTSGQNGGFAGYQSPQTQQGPKSPIGPPPVGGQRPTSAYGNQSQQSHQSHQSQMQSQAGRPPQQNYQSPPPPGQGQGQGQYQASPGNYGQNGAFGQGGAGAGGYGQSAQGPGAGGYSNAAAPPSGYQNSYQPPALSQQQQAPPQQYGGQYGGTQQAGSSSSNPFHRSASPAPQNQHQHQHQQQSAYGRTASPAPGPGPAYQQQQQGYHRSASPAPAPAPQQQPYQQGYQSRSPVGEYGGGQQSQQRHSQQYGQSQQQQQHRQSQQYQAPPPQQQQQQQQQQQYQPPIQHQQPQQQDRRMQRSPSPQPGVAPANAAPTGQWSTTGLPVLFYVKALYDYQALSGAEFDFQAGDIIAVTSTPDDGWWSGELLDEARRLPGRTDFPSNL